MKNYTKIKLKKPQTSPSHFIEQSQHEYDPNMSILSTAEHMDTEHHDLSFLRLYQGTALKSQTKYYKTRLRDKKKRKEKMIHNAQNQVEILLSRGALLSLRAQFGFIPPKHDAA